MLFNKETIFYNKKTNEYLWLEAIAEDKLNLSQSELIILRPIKWRLSNDRNFRRLVKLKNRIISTKEEILKDFEVIKEKELFMKQFYDNDSNKKEFNPKK